MSDSPERRGRPESAEVALLLRHDSRRIGANLRHPRAGVWVGILLPLVLVVGTLWAVGSGALPNVQEVGGAVMLGFLVSVPLAFFSYGVLFRPSDDPLLRRLGFAAVPLFVVRALRLAGVALAVTLVLLIPFLSAGTGVGRALLLALAAGVVAWGLSLLALSYAAAAIATPGRRPGIFSRAMGFDRELVAAGPLVYAPLAPLFGGIAAAGVIAAAAGAAWMWVAGAVILALLSAAAAARLFARGFARFAPRALEMAFAPPPEAGEAGLVLERGTARFVPRPVAAVWARDAVVAERRFRWATSIVWPVAIAGVIALAQWGTLPAVRTWVLGAGALVLVAQGAAVVGLGRLERAGPRWVDRALGLAWPARWAGRWLFGFGLSLWLTVPLGLAWGWWAGAGSGWLWVGAGLVGSAVASGASLAASGR